VDLAWQFRLEVDGTEIVVPEVLLDEFCDYYTHSRLSLKYAHIKEMCSLKSI
jgi:hypothetical protein